MPEVLITANSDSTTNKRKMTEPLESILTEFEFVKVLNENAENKLVFIHALKRMTAADDQKKCQRQRNKQKRCPNPGEAAFRSGRNEILSGAESRA